MTAIKKARYSSGDGLCILDKQEVSCILDRIEAPKGESRGECLEGQNGEEDSTSQKTCGNKTRLAEY